MTETAETRADPDAQLPAIVGIRAHADGNESVVVEFANGARIRYRERDDGIAEAWLGPGADDPDIVHDREEDDESAETVALRTIGAYLSFDSRQRAEFVWGAENLATLLGE